MNEDKRNEFEEFRFASLTALGSLMTCNEVCKNQRVVMKINRFRVMLMDLERQTNKDPETIKATDVTVDW